MVAYTARASPQHDDVNFHFCTGSRVAMSYLAASGGLQTAFWDICVHTKHVHGVMTSPGSDSILLMSE